MAVITLKVQDFRGRTTNIRVDPKETILHLKNKVHIATGIPVDLQNFLFMGRTLQNESTIEAEHLTEDCTITMMVQSEGGSVLFVY